MPSLSPTPRTQFHRLPERGSFDQTSIHAILDAARIGHLAFHDAHLGHVAIIPTLIARVGSDVVLHMNRIGRFAESLRLSDVCLSVAIEDGLVLAKSAFHHSMNYRSVILYGRPREIMDASAKVEALKAFTDKVTPGRWEQVRPPSPKELAITAVFALPILEASAKIRTGPPKDDPDDLALPVQAGIIPLRQVEDAFEVYP